MRFLHLPTPLAENVGLGGIYLFVGSMKSVVVRLKSSSEGAGVEYSVHSKGEYFCAANPLALLELCAINIADACIWTGLGSSIDSRSAQELDF
jgi:hypothetical protein